MDSSLSCIVRLGDSHRKSRKRAANNDLSQLNPASTLEVLLESKIALYSIVNPGL
jgi:hypothetical protein